MCGERLSPEGLGVLHASCRRTGGDDGALGLPKGAAETEGIGKAYEGRKGRAIDLIASTTKPALPSFAKDDGRSKMATGPVRLGGGPFGGASFNVRIGNMHTYEVDFDVPTTWYEHGAYEDLVSRDEVLARVWALFSHDALSDGLSSGELDTLIERSGCVGLATDPGKFWTDSGGYAWNGYRTMLQLVATYFAYVEDGESPIDEDASPCVGMSSARSTLLKGASGVSFFIHGPRFNERTGTVCIDGGPDPAPPAECLPCYGYAVWDHDFTTARRLGIANGSNLYSVDWVVGTDWYWGSFAPDDPESSATPLMVVTDEDADTGGSSAFAYNHRGIHLRADLIGRAALLADWMLHWAHVALALAELAIEDGRYVDGLALQRQAEYLGRYALRFLLDYSDSIVHELAHAYAETDDSFAAEWNFHTNTEKCCACTTELAFDTGVAARLGLVMYQEDSMEHGAGWRCYSLYWKRENGCSDDDGQYTWQVAFTDSCEPRGERQFASHDCSPFASPLGVEIGYLYAIP